jgi:putative phosphoesterase
MSMLRRNCTIGVISDTHGLVRPRAVDELKSSDLILHAGDIGSQDVLSALRSIAPVVAVRGNTDRGPWTDGLRDIEITEISGFLFYLIHDTHDIDLDPAAAGIRAIISGHSHRPAMVEQNGILHLNPGSAGPRRFTLPVTMARIRILDGALQPEIIHIG